MIPTRAKWVLMYMWALLYFFTYLPIVLPHDESVPIRTQHALYAAQVCFFVLVWITGINHIEEKS